MAVGAGLGTYQVPTRPEDVLDMVSNISPFDAQLVTGLGKSKAENTLHQWTEDTYAAAADNAAAEGDEITTVDLTAPAYGFNFTQIFRKVIQVTRTEAKVGAYGIKDMFQHKKVKAAKELTQDMEYAVMRGSGVSGTTSAARRMKGVLAFISTNATAQTSGTCLTEVLFNDLLADTWTNSRLPANEVYSGLYLKRAISAYTAGATKNVEITDKRLVNAVDVYESDASEGLVKLFKHRHIPTDTVAAIRNEMFKIAYLDNPQVVPLGRTGDAEKAYVVAEATLECHGEKANAKRSGYFVG